jgi:hypothetical protein
MGRATLRQIRGSYDKAANGKSAWHALKKG